MGTATATTHAEGPEDRVPALRLDAIESFLVVAREKSLSRAAKCLFLTQSGVTRRIQALERALGCSLFIRTTRRVQLTNAGRALLPYAEDLLATGHELQAKLTGVSKVSAVHDPDHDPDHDA